MSQSALPKLSLYHRNFCWFCSSVLHEIKALDMESEVEGRNIWQDAEALQELEQATGRTTVPVLRIENTDGKVTWMPESSDIVQYLHSLHGPADATA